MKVIKIYDLFRNDCTMDCKCEHCGNVRKDTSAYNDAYYINTVVGESYCKKCNKNAKGQLKTVKES